MGAEGGSPELELSLGAGDLNDRPNELVVVEPRVRSLSAQPGGIVVPDLVARAGERASYRYAEFFAGAVRNPNTRRAYGRAVERFLEACEGLGVELREIHPLLVSAYVEELGRQVSVPTVKQHLAALRMFFDFLVTGHLLETNPAASVRGPKHVVRKGKTPVLFQDDLRQLFDSLPTDHVVALRDRALLGVMVYSFARVGAVVGMRVRDFYTQGRRAWLNLQEKGGRYLRVPTHHVAGGYLDAYLKAAGVAEEREGPLFRSTRGRSRRLTDRGMSTRDVGAMVKRRAKAAGLPQEITCHSFRAAGITNYLANGGSLEVAARVAGHASTKTTQIYDRRSEEVELGEIERIRF